mmetsp:Transcript_17857/g.32291  ORF Transcript_17857/g.32291 Transcript_17857/m.32291 type:complete len:82 (+) Transcript_17857:858-1103(+)
MMATPYHHQSCARGELLSSMKKAPHHKSTQSMHGRSLNVVSNTPSQIRAEFIVLTQKHSRDHNTTITHRCPTTINSKTTVR